MDCEEAKVLIGGDPGSVPVELHKHLSSCRDCQKFSALILAFETRLRAALEFDVTTLMQGQSRASALERQAISVPQRASGKTRHARQWRLGIGLAAALLAGFVLWLSRPPQTLAAEVISHVEHEPESWSRTRPVSVSVVDSVLRGSGLVPRAVMASIPVVYARNCDFRGHLLAHLVVMTEVGPVTVLVLTHERVRVIERFESDGYRGVLVPMQGGSIAVVSHSDIALEKATSEVLHGFEVVSSRGYFGEFHYVL